jgi:ADP-heptose:LPS heptosyltransferase
VLITGESTHADAIEKLLPPTSEYPVISLGGHTNVPELAALIEEAALLVTNLTSTAHIASASATPTVLLYPGTEMVSQWELYGCRHELLRNETPCMPCYRFECPLNHECMDVSPADVLEASEQLLYERRSFGMRRTA